MWTALWLPIHCACSQVTSFLEPSLALTIGSCVTTLKTSMTLGFPHSGNGSVGGAPSDTAHVWLYPYLQEGCVSAQLGQVFVETGPCSSGLREELLPLASCGNSGYTG